MTAEYPDTVYNPRTKENKADVVYTPAKTKVTYVEDITKLDAEVVAIETELGTDASGAFATVKAWLTALSSLLGAHKTQHENAGGDEISVAGLSGELADNQPAKAHQASHKHDGSDPITGAGIEIEKFIVFQFDGGGSAITFGIKGVVTIPFKCEILSWTLLADENGNFTVDILKNTYAEFWDLDGKSITNNNYPDLDGVYKNTDSTLTGWTKTIDAGDILIPEVRVGDTAKSVTLTIKVKLVE